MARTFSSIEARRLINEHKELLSELFSASDNLDFYKKQITEAANKLIADEVLKVLRDIPVDELSREKSGIRIKALMDANFNTIADLYVASVYSIASVRGISEDTAYTIKRIVNDYVSTARNGVKLKLSTDNKTPNSTKLIGNISKYKRAIPIVNECDLLLNANHKKIKYAIEDISFSISGIKWIFASKAKKETAEKAYNLLNYLILNEYGRKSEELLNQLRTIKNCTDNLSWEDFSNNPVEFFNILEDIVPGVLGNDDAVYGLPEDLAREIQDECFFPDGLKCTLRRYQEWGVKYTLHQERVLLGDEMGLGSVI